MGITECPSPRKRLWRIPLIQNAGRKWKRPWYMRGVHMRSMHGGRMNSRCINFMNFSPFALECAGYQISSLLSIYDDWKFQNFLVLYYHYLCDTSIWVHNPFTLHENLIPSEIQQPQTKSGKNSFGGLGATLIDSLDTLYIMGLEEQFQKARE